LQVVRNELLHQPFRYQADEVLLMLARGPDCFDHKLYVTANKDLAGLAGGGRQAPTSAAAVQRVI
jgi:hypothetical protein